MSYSSIVSSNIGGGGGGRETLMRTMIPHGRISYRADEEQEFEQTFLVRISAIEYN